MACTRLNALSLLTEEKDDRRFENNFMAVYPFLKTTWTSVQRPTDWAASLLQWNVSHRFQSGPLIGARWGRTVMPVSCYTTTCPRTNSFVYFLITISCCGFSERIKEQVWILSPKNTAYFIDKKNTWLPAVSDALWVCMYFWFRFETLPGIQ